MIETASTQSSILSTTSKLDRFIPVLSLRDHQLLSTFRLVVNQPRLAYGTNYLVNRLLISDLIQWFRVTLYYVTSCHSRTIPPSSNSSSSLRFRFLRPRKSTEIERHQFCGAKALAFFSLLSASRLHSFHQSRHCSLCEYSFYFGEFCFVPQLLFESSSSILVSPLSFLSHANIVPFFTLSSPILGLVANFSALLFRVILVTVFSQPSLDSTIHIPSYYCLLLHIYFCFELLSKTASSYCSATLF